MIILAVESSCDETAVALVRDGRTVLADCIASSVEMHRIYGGVVPEIASRKHIEVIAQLADQALEQAGLLVTGIVNRETWAALQAQSCNCDKEE